MFVHARKHLIAWPGLVAMWLIVLAPLVSHIVAVHRDGVTEGVLCSAAQPPASGARHDHGVGFAACGYCSLLADHAAMPPMQAALPALFVTGAPAVMALSLRHIPFGPFPCARPRAPPPQS
ncbi:DUF2946 family protein [Paraburkholderia acidipaludis]|uniref:DUF2946 family protein n=1 Tax=Paraburkholderia acidipaludis TaxID=660537 RepID=UPI0004821DB2|nr:DUF2946 family protein [Paraburkholderia acidipaludis]